MRGPLSPDSGCHTLIPCFLCPLSWEGKHSPLQTPLVHCHSWRGSPDARGGHGAGTVSGYSLRIKLQGRASSTLCYCHVSSSRPNAVQVWEAVIWLCRFPTRLQDGNNIKTSFPEGDLNWIDSINWFSLGNQPRVAISLFLTNDKSTNCTHLWVFIFHCSKAASHKSLFEQTTLLISKETPYLPWQTLRRSRTFRRGGRNKAQYSGGVVGNFQGLISSTVCTYTFWTGWR